MLRHKASLLHTAYEHPCPQHMKPRLRKGHRQQHAAAVHHSRTLCQRGEVLPGKLLPGSKALGRGGLPCPGIPAAGAAAGAAAGEKKEEKKEKKAVNVKLVKFDAKNKIKVAV